MYLQIKQLSLFLLALLLTQINGLQLKTTDTKEYCFSVKGRAGQYLHFSYMVRGRNEDNVALKVFVITIDVF